MMDIETSGSPVTAAAAPDRKKRLVRRPSWRLLVLVAGLLLVLAELQLVSYREVPVDKEPWSTERNGQYRVSGISLLSGRVFDPDLPWLQGVLELLESSFRTTEPFPAAW